MTNEERFIASCERVGEGDVRAKVSAGRYSDLKAVWATNWLERVESSKSDVTKADEISRRLRDLGRAQSNSAITKLALLLAVLIVSVIGIALF